MAVHPVKPRRRSKPPAFIDKESCSGCGVCVYFCPIENCILPLTAAEGGHWQVFRVVTQRCIGCTLCAQFCPWACITMVDPSRGEVERQHDREAMAQP